MKSCDSPKSEAVEGLAVSRRRCVFCPLLLLRLSVFAFGRQGVGRIIPASQSLRVLRAKKTFAQGDDLPILDPTFGGPAGQLIGSDGGGFARRRDRERLGGGDQHDPAALLGEIVAQLKYAGRLRRSRSYPASRARGRAG